MCRKADCLTCHNTTWVGCGSHIPSVMDSIPKAKWCTCEHTVEEKTNEYPPKLRIPAGYKGF